MQRVTKRQILSVTALLSAGLAVSAAAHNPLDHPEWCSEGRLLVVDEFEWEGESLARIVEEKRQGDTCAGPKSRHSGTRTCGQFDDDWGAVNSRAANHCGRFAVRFVDATHRDHGTVVHIAEAPSEFNDDQRHHERYRASMGLRAMCIRCEPPVIEPAGPVEQLSQPR